MAKEKDTSSLGYTSPSATHLPCTITPLFHASSHYLSLLSNCPGTAKQWLPPHTQHSDVKSLLSLQWVALGVERRGWTIFPNKSEGRIWTQRNKYGIEWIVNLDEWATLDDETYSHFLPTQQDTEEGTILYKEDEGPVSVTVTIYIWPGVNPTLDTIQEKHQQTPNTVLYSLSSYLLNLCAHLSLPEWEVAWSICLIDPCSIENLESVDMQKAFNTGFGELT